MHTLSLPPASLMTMSNPKSVSSSRCRSSRATSSAVPCSSVLLGLRWPPDAPAGPAACCSSCRAQGRLVGRDLRESKAMLLGASASGLTARWHASGTRSGVDLRCAMNTCAWHGSRRRRRGGVANAGRR